MTYNRDEEQAIAFAGLVQACYAVDQLARKGVVGVEVYDPLMHSLFEFSPVSTEAIFTGVAPLRPGLEAAHAILTGKNAAHYTETVRYLIGTIYLEGKLRHREDLLKIIRNRLEHASYRYEHFDNNWRDLAAAISSIYQDTVSTFRFRIQVAGTMRHLQDQHVAAQVRTLLLAGIRCAMLWRQLGGRRWHLLLKRKRMARALEQLLHKY